MSRHRESSSSKDTIAESESGSSGSGQQSNEPSRQSFSGTASAVTLSIARDFNLKSLFKPSNNRASKEDILVSILSEWSQSTNQMADLYVSIMRGCFGFYVQVPRELDTCGF